jgi:hypothetical protein
VLLDRRDRLDDHGVALVDRRDLGAGETFEPSTQRVVGRRHPRSHRVEFTTICMTSVNDGRIGQTFPDRDDAENRI